MGETIPFWRKIWQSVAVYNQNIRKKDMIKELLDEVGKDLYIGLNAYPAFEVSDFDKWVKEMDVVKSSTNLARFFRRTCTMLNLEPSVCWNVVCNYLTYEYRGKVSDMEDIIRYTLCTKNFIDDIWHFYTSERMFLLKTLRYVLESSYDKEEDYYDLYAGFVKRVSMSTIRDHLFKQLDYLMHEVNTLHAKNCISMEEWVDRNHREMLEVVLSLTVTSISPDFTMTEYVEMLKLFVKYDFASSPSYVANVSMGSSAQIKAHFAELGAFIAGLEKCWQDPDRWIKFKPEIERMIMDVSRKGDNNVLYLVWSTLHASLEGSEAEDTYNTYYSKLTALAFKENALQTLFHLAQYAAKFGGLSGKLMVNSIYTVFNYICDCFNENDFVYSQNHACELLNELLKHKNLAERCFQPPEQPVCSIFVCATKMFPYDFHHLTAFAETLMHHEDFTQKVVDKLNLLSNYCEPYLDRISESEIITLNNDYHPEPMNDLIKLPKGTRGVGMQRFGKRFVIYNYSYSYYTVLKQQVQLLTKKADTQGVIDETLMERVEAGYKLLILLFRKGEAFRVDEKEIQEMLQILNLIITTFWSQRFKVKRMIKMFFEVAVAVAISDYHITIQLHNTALLPRLIKEELKFSDLYRDDVFTESIMWRLLKEEEPTSNHDLCLLYIELIKDSVLKGKNLIEIQIPGIVYVVRTVFTKHLDWEYQQVKQKYEILHECLRLIHKILSIDSTNMAEPYRKLLFDFCLEVSLNNEVVVKGYMEIYRMSSIIIEKQMESETDWKDGDNLVHVKNLKILLALTLLLVKYRRFYKKSALSLFETKLVDCSFEKVAPVKRIASLIEHPFDLTIPKLAVRVLQNVAMEDQCPLFGPLDLDDFQLQSLFLEKLRDPVEDQELKLAIIDLICVSVEHQPGLTGAFFNARQLYKPSGTSGRKPPVGEESVSSFMIDYLENLKKSSEYLRNPLQFAILEVMHKLWDSGKVGLIKDMLEFDHFWHILSDPLFGDIKLDNKLYSLIFGIFSIELHQRKGKIHKDLGDVIKKLFDPKQEFFEKWKAHLVSASYLQDHPLENQFSQPTVPPEVYLLSAWKGFVVFTERCIPCFDDAKLRAVMIEMCLDGLIAHFSAPQDQRVFKIWSELYLICINRWTGKSFENGGGIFAKLTKVLQCLLTYYPAIIDDCKEALLAATSKTLINFKDFISENADILNEFLAPVGQIMILEYNYLEHVAANKEIVRNTSMHLNKWILVLSIGNNLLSIKNIQAHNIWFDGHDFLSRTLACVCEFLRHPKTIHISKIAMQSLVVYVQSPQAKDFIIFDDCLDSFSSDVIVASHYISNMKVSLENISLIREWWITYSEIVKMYNLLLGRFGARAADKCFSFLYSHDVVLVNSLRLISVTVDRTALKLVCQCIAFCNRMMTWKAKWYDANSASFFRIVNAVAQAINSIIDIVMRPKIMVFATLEANSTLISCTDVHEEILIETLNLLIEVMTLSFSAFVRCNPNLLLQLDLNFYEPKAVFIIKKDFHVPKSSSDNGELTYGGLICLLHFLCKALAKSTIKTSVRESDYASKKVPLIGLIKREALEKSPHEGATTVQRFISSGFAFLEIPLSGQVNQKMVHTATELLGTFMALQVFMDLYHSSVPVNIHHYLKREFHAELQVFIEFIRKRMNEHFYTSNVLPLELRRRSGTKAEAVKISKYLSMFGDKLTTFEIKDEYLYLLCHWFCNICQLNN